MNKYTFFYYDIIFGQRLSFYDYVEFASLHEAKKSANKDYDEVFFIAEGHITNLQETES